MMWYGDHMTGWGYAFAGVSSLLFWTALIVGGVAVFRHYSRGPGMGVAARLRSSPEQMFAERYARGEIDDVEYRQGLATLRAERPPVSKPSS